MTDVLAAPRWRQRFTRVALVATAATAVIAAAATSATAATTDDGFNPGPNRLIDTRIDMNDQPAGPVTGFVQTQLPDSVPNGATALLSVTVVNPTTSGYIKVYADGNDVPATSDVNFVAGDTVAQAVVVEAAANSSGKVDLFIGGNNAPIDLVVDVTGSFPGNTYTSLGTAIRTYDTRDAGINSTPGKKGPGIYPVVLPTGEGGIPDDAQAVAVTVTQTGATGNGFVSVLSDSLANNSSSLNYTSTSINSNLVLVKPNQGRIYLQVGGGSTTDLIVDVKGYTSSQAVTAVTPIRALDSRTAAGGGLLGQGFVNVPLPATAPTGASFALLNVTATEATNGGYIASYRAEAGELQTSNLNWAPNQNVAGFVIAPVVDGQAQIYIGVGQTKVIADIEGYVVNNGTQDN